MVIIKLIKAYEEADLCSSVLVQVMIFVKECKPRSGAKTKHVHQDMKIDW